MCAAGVDRAEAEEDLGRRDSRVTSGQKPCYRAGWESSENPVVCARQLLWLVAGQLHAFSRQSLLSAREQSPGHVLTGHSPDHFTCVRLDQLVCGSRLGLWTEMRDFQSPLYLHD